MITRATLASLVAGTLLATAGPVRAATVLTTDALPFDATSALLCVALNVGTRPITGMTVTMIDVATQASTTALCGVVDPDKTCAAPIADIPVGRAFCRITFSGSSKNLRGTLMAQPAAGGVSATSQAR